MKVFLENIATGEQIPVELGVISIGRKGADIPAVHELVSSKHLEISFTGSRLVLTDLNSTNGTYLNGEEVRRKTLKNGDIISLGDPDYNNVPSYKVVIEGDSTRVTHRIKPKRSLKRYILIVFVVLILILGLLSLFNDDSFTERVMQKIEEAENSQVTNFTDGQEISLIYACKVRLPNGYTWLKEQSYQRLEGVTSNVFSDNVGTNTIWNKVDKQITGSNFLKAVISFQKIRPDFVGDIENQALKNFLWHEDVFLKENHIKGTFLYRNTKSGIWQWVMWYDNDMFNIYANTVNEFARIIIRISASDIKFINMFFIDLVDSLTCKN